jgi:hypothetical protein
MPKPHQKLIVYVHLHSDTENYPGRATPQLAFRDEGALLCALGWHVTMSESLKQFSKARCQDLIARHHADSCRVPTRQLASPDERTSTLSVHEL